MPQEAQAIQFDLPGKPTLLELCQRLMEAARGTSDPILGDEFSRSLEALRLASAHWVENDDPFDAGVLAMVRTTILLVSPLPRERAEMYSAVLDAVSEHRDALRVRRRERREDPISQGRGLLCMLVEDGDLVRSFRVHSPFDNHCGLQDYATIAEIPPVMVDDWRDPPCEFAVSIEDDVREMFKRGKA